MWGIDDAGSAPEFRGSGSLVWFFALGYFAFYIPYAALVRAMTQGYLTPGQKPVSGFDILPATLLGTIITMPLLIAALGGFHLASARRISGATCLSPSSTLSSPALPSQ